MKTQQTLPPNVEQLLTVNQTCAALDVSRSKVYDLINSGELKTIRVGERLRVRVRDLNAYIEALARDGSAP